MRGAHEHVDIKIVGELRLPVAHLRVPTSVQFGSRFALRHTGCTPLVEAVLSAERLSIVYCHTCVTRSDVVFDNMLHRYHFLNQKITRAITEPRSPLYTPDDISPWLGLVLTGPREDDQEGPDQQSPVYSKDQRVPRRWSWGRRTQSSCRPRPLPA